MSKIALIILGMPVALMGIIGVIPEIALDTEPVGMQLLK